MSFVFQPAFAEGRVGGTLYKTESRYANFDIESLEGCCGGVKIISSIGYDIGEPVV